jgi:Homeodomain
MQRSPSVSSSLSTPTAGTDAADTTSTTSSVVPASPVKTITRKRLLPAQAGALKKMFQAKSHPSKEERLALANEINM